MIAAFIFTTRPFSPPKLNGKNLLCHSISFFLIKDCWSNLIKDLSRELKLRINSIFWSAAHGLVSIPFVPRISPKSDFNSCPNSLLPIHQSVNTLPLSENYLGLWLFVDGLPGDCSSHARNTIPGKTARLVPVDVAIISISFPPG